MDQGRLLLLLSSLLFVSSCYGRTFITVPPGEEVCFFEDLQVGELLRGSYQTVQGGEIDLAVIQVRTKKNLVSQYRQSEGHFEERVKVEGRYRVCFGNRLSTSVAKKVQVAVHGGELDDLVEHEATGIAEVGHLDRLNGYVLRLARRVSDLKEQEEYLRRRSERHHITTESTNSRVWLSSVFEALVLVGVNMWQIYYLRRFFEVKRII